MMDVRKMTPPMGPGGPPPEGGPGPGPGGPMARLGAEYSFEILAPAGVPVKQLHIDLDKMTAVLDTEHGSQDVMDFKLEKDIFSFRAMLGSAGDELFEVKAKLYPGGIALGEAYMVGDNKPKSPSVFREIS